LSRIALLTCVGALLAAGGAAGIAPGLDAREADAATVVPASPAVAAVNSVTFRDATGEDPDGPDITTVAVSNDDAGLITFRVAIPSRPTLIEGMRFRIWIDSDDDPATGLSMNGMDHFLLHEGGRTGLYRCGGSMCSGGGDVSRTLEFSYAGGPRFAILTDELGLTKRFRFAVEAATGIFVDPVTKTVDATDAHFDDAPERGRHWTASVQIGPQRLLVRSLGTTPAVARAGRPFSVRLTATRSDTGAVVSSGRVACAARIAGERVVPRSQRFIGDRAVCVFRIPADVAGKTIRGSITVSFAGKKVSREFLARIGL